MTFIHALALALLLQAPPDLEQIVRERAAAHGVDGDFMVQLAICESQMNPSAIGSQGEIGLYQLWPEGLLPLFYRRGYSDPWSGQEQADFASWAVANGLRSQWHC